MEQMDEQEDFAAINRRKLFCYIYISIIEASGMGCSRVFSQLIKVASMCARESALLQELSEYL